MVSTSAKYDKSPRWWLDQRKLGTVNWVPEETTPTKSPPRSWRQTATDPFQGNNCKPGQTVVKRANCRKGERSDRLSSIKSNFAYASRKFPPPNQMPQVMPESNSAGASRIFRSTGYMWVDGQDGPRHVSRNGRRIPPLGHVCSANVLGLIDSNISGRNRTGPQKCRQWKPPMLILDLAITPERDTLPVHGGQSGKQNRFWMSVGIEGKVSSSAG